MVRAISWAYVQFGGWAWMQAAFYYVSLGLYAAFRPPLESVRWAHTRALLTMVSFVVNVLVI